MASKCSSNSLDWLLLRRLRLYPAPSVSERVNLLFVVPGLEYSDASSTPKSPKSNRAEELVSDRREVGQSVSIASFCCNNVGDDLAAGFPVGGELEEDKMFETLKGFNDSELLMAAGSNNGQDTEKSQQGVVQGHAYSILDVKEVGDYKLVQLRNPWGQSEYTGPWSDGSPEWDQNPDVAAECGYTGPADDGKFWMPWDEFGREYGSIGVCKGAGGKRSLPAGKPPAACGCVLQ
jgi:hypothetical protein